VRSSSSNTGLARWPATQARDTASSPTRFYQERVSTTRTEEQASSCPFQTTRQVALSITGSRSETNRMVTQRPRSGGLEALRICGRQTHGTVSRSIAAGNGHARIEDGLESSRRPHRRGSDRFVISSRWSRPRAQALAVPQPSGIRRRQLGISKRKGMSRYLPPYLRRSR